jgi:hypothetical protein
MILNHKFDCLPDFSLYNRTCLCRYADIRYKDTYALAWNGSFRIALSPRNNGLPTTLSLSFRLNQWSEAEPYKQIRLYSMTMNLATSPYERTLNPPQAQGGSPASNHSWALVARVAINILSPL